MIDDLIISKFLDTAVKKSMDSLEKNGTLTTEEAIPLMLKSQFNHIKHLDAQMVTKSEFSSAKWFIGIILIILSMMIGVLALIQGYAVFFAGPG